MTHKYDPSETRKRVHGLLFSTRGTFIQRVMITYVNPSSSHSSKQQAHSAFNRAVEENTLGSNHSDLAGMILIVPEPPFGEPVFVKGA